ncbi:MAG: alanine racemase [Paludibacteraceae bacterium]
MAYITFNTAKLKFNYVKINKLFAENEIKWSVVTKLLCGNKALLTELLKLDIKQVSDSRISNLRTIKNLDASIETIYIKPPAKNNISNVVNYADISLNTESRTIRLLSDEAQRQGKIHKVIIMMELGELREGVTTEKLFSMYETVYQLKNIEIVGIGANLSCLYGVLPSSDKLRQLIQYKNLLEDRFGQKIRYVSGGSSVTIHLILTNELPKGINHFRVGETLFFGTDVFTGLEIDELENDIFKLYSQIIEISEKPMEPDGEFGTNLEGNTYEVNENLIGKRGTRAIIDVGLLDVDPNHLRPTDKQINVVGATSDMIVVNLDETEKSYKVGDIVEFDLDYYSTLKLLNSKYVVKKVI